MKTEDRAHMTIKVNGVTLFYEMIGSGAPLIMVHGNGEDHTIFNKAAEKLKDHYTLILPDSRGHGQSEAVLDIHYEDMAKDIHELAIALNLKKPALYGFSDGGIIGLLVAAMWPDQLSRLVVSGANVFPEGLKAADLARFAEKYQKTGNPRYRMILEEPHISDEILGNISIPTDVLAGSNDMINDEHTRYIARHIKRSVLHIFPGETHESYVVNSEKIADYLLSALPADFRS